MNITLTIEQLAAINTLAKHVASSNDQIPIICSVQLRLEAGKVTAIATDRYRVGELTFTLEKAALEEAVDGTVLVSVAILTRVISMLKGEKATNTPRVSITGDDREVTIRDQHTGGLVVEMAFQGNYPPVEKLIPDTDKLVDFQAGISLNMGYFTAPSQLHFPGEKAATAKLQAWHVGGTKTENPMKPGPILIWREMGTMAYRYLLQPNYLKS